MDSFYPNPAPHLSEIIVETTTACNIKCIHCAVSNEGYAIKTLRYESFENIVSIMQTYKPLVKLNGHGETLIHKRFFDMLDVAIGAGCQVVFQTNATRLVPEVSKRLLHYAGPDKLMAISISIDGVGEVFNKVRRQADWDEYVYNIKTFRDLRTASQSPYPYLNFQFTAMLLNIHTLPATVAMVKELGGSAITVGDLLEYPTAAGQSVTRDLAYARPFYGNRSASENLTLALRSPYGLPCPHGYIAGITTRGMGADPTRCASLYSGAGSPCGNFDNAGPCLTGAGRHVARTAAPDVTEFFPPPIERSAPVSTSASPAE